MDGRQQQLVIGAREFQPGRRPRAEHRLRQLPQPHRPQSSHIRPKRCRSTLSFQGGRMGIGTVVYRLGTGDDGAYLRKGVLYVPCKRGSVRLGRAHRSARTLLTGAVLQRQSANPNDSKLQLTVEGRRPVLCCRCSGLQVFWLDSSMPSAKMRSVQRA